MLSIITDGGELQLLAEKALHIPYTNTLVLADLHVGKGQHFRKHGVPIPSSAARDDLARLDALLKKTSCKEVVFLGDLGHSDFNDEWVDFARLLSNYPSIDFRLTRGNHDREPGVFYRELGILETEPSFLRDGFLLSHDAQKTSAYNLIGHEHPAIMVKGKGKLRMRFPCFYFGNKHGVLPAFTDFSGHHVIRPEKGIRVYPVFKTSVWEINSS